MPESLPCVAPPKHLGPKTMHPAAAERSRRGRRPSNPAEAALAAATEAAAAVTAGFQGLATPLGEQQFETHDPDPALWSVNVDVRLPNSQHAVGVSLTVHAAGQMTLEWPSFGGLQAGQAHILHLPDIETLSLKATARPCLLYTSPSPRDRSLSRMPSSA